MVEGRLAAVRATIEHFNIILMNVYAPTIGPRRIQFLQVPSTVLSQVNTEEEILIVLRIML